MATPNYQLPLTDQEAQLARIYGDTSGVGQINSGISPDQYYSSLDPTAQNKSIADYIRLAMEQGGTQLQRQFAPQYEQLQSEQAAMGRRGSPVALASTGRLRNTQGQAISDLISSLMGKQAELQYGASAKRPEQMLAGASLFGNQNLQGQQLGLQARSGLSDLLNQEKNRVQNETQFQRQQNFNIGQLAQQGTWDREKTGALLKAQQDANEKGGWDRFGQVTTGLGNLGGLGRLWSKG